MTVWNPPSMEGAWQRARWGYPRPYLWESRNKGDTISASTRRAKETASQNTLRWKSENDSSEGLGCSVMTHCGIRQQIRCVQILFSLRWYVELILQSRTLSWCSQSSMNYSEEEPALQCRTICAPDSSSLKPGSGATEGFLD